MRLKTSKLHKNRVVVRCGNLFILGGSVFFVTNRICLLFFFEFKRKLVLYGQNGALGVKLTYPLVSKIVQVRQGQQSVVFPVYEKPYNPSLGEKFPALNVVLPAFARIHRDNPRGVVGIIPHYGR